MRNTLAIVLASGGMDSTVTAALAARQYSRLAFLFVRYGQRTEKRELKAFGDIADYYGVKNRLVTSVEYLKQVGGSSLTDPGIPVPTGKPAQPGIPDTYVPFRNTHLISIAVSWAEVIGASRILYGAVKNDYTGYPDTTRRYVQAMQRLINAGTNPKHRIELKAPLINLNKWQVVRKGIQLNAPYHLTWSCYQNAKISCGICDSCAQRREGFAKAGITDPLRYKSSQVKH
jgi:7-cyano-7-deazaguanine synthase